MPVQLSKVVQKRIAAKPIAKIATPDPIFCPPERIVEQPKVVGRPPDRWKAAVEQHIYTPTFYINRTLTPLSGVDPITRSWIRNANDERSAQEAKCRFSEKKGQFVVNWVEKYCYLYEGDKAGQLIDVDDWQYEYFMQVFGWLQYAEDLGKWIRRFRQAGVWIPKKNAKSPTLAATGVYLLIGDGEKGQKVYSVARDGKQALIAHTHAMEMVRSSPDLFPSECKINNTTGTISHLPTRSRYQVVFGENKLSTEGYNGSLLVDETHVVDQKLIDRLKRAGISRREPLHIEMSTAGDTAEGYGEARYAYGKSIQDGTTYNPHFYFMDFAIPQTTGIEQLYDEEYIRREGVRCNPTLGRIIRLTELIDDWTQSKQSQTELRKFAMYRLNLWTKGGANWIEMPDWLACRKQYTLAQLAEYPCLGGLDMSKTLDMTAFTLIFAVPHKHLGVLPHTWHWHWLPHRTAVRYQAKKNLFELARNPTGKPLINFGKTKAISYELIAGHLEWVKNNFDLRGIGYDPYNSDVLMERLYNDYGWGEDMMTIVKQNMPTMGPPTAEIERLILRKEIRHPGNPVLDWQFEHCEVDEDDYGNKRPIKPDKDDFRKIDGIISTIIALAMFNNDENVRATYGDRESILLFPSEKTGKDIPNEEEESDPDSIIEDEKPEDFDEEQ